MLFPGQNMFYLFNLVTGSHQIVQDEMSNISFYNMRNLAIEELLFLAEYHFNIMFLKILKYLLHSPVSKQLYIMI